MDTLITILLFIILLVISIQKPLFGIFLLYVLSTGFFHLIEMKELPTIQVAGTGDIQLYDLFLGALFIASVIKLIKNKEEILFSNVFWWFVFLIITIFLYSLFSSKFELRSALNSLRKLFSYSFYFILIANIRSKENLVSLIKIIYIILLIALALQLYEVIGDTRIVLIQRAELRAYWDVAPEISLSSGEQVSYIWNRAAVLTYFGTFIAFGLLLVKKPVEEMIKGNQIIFALGLIAFILALTRSWFIYIALGIIISLFLSVKSIKKLLLIGLSIAFTFLIINQIIALFQSSNAAGTTERLFSRLASIFDVFNGSNGSFNVRLLVYAQQFALFLQNPLFGLGFTKTTFEELNGDVGFGNTLLQFGSLGLLWVFYLIFQIISKLKNLKNNSYNKMSQGLIVGISGAFGGMLLGYFFNWDFFGRVEGIYCVVTIMAMIDRLTFFEKRQFVGSQNT